MAYHAALWPCGLVTMKQLLLIFIVLVGACRSTTKNHELVSYPPLVPDEFGSMHNVSCAGPIWIGGMPSSDDLELAQRRGVELVIDLSVPSEESTCEVRTQCRLFGLTYASAGLENEDQLTSESVDLVLANLRSADLPPTLMFCGTGSRSAAYLAIYRVTELGVPLEDALVEARRAGMQVGAAAAFVRAESERILRLAGQAQARFVAQ
jgi:protein tyrosine phosphatase (PTP) superfamily phosphohydrolase (DUF442 family)